MHRKVTLRVNLLTYFLLVVGLVALALIGLQYYFSLRLSNQAAEHTFNQSAQRLSTFIEEQDNQLIDLLSMLVTDEQLSALPEPGELHSAHNMFKYVADTKNHVSTIYVLKDSGELYWFARLDKSPQLAARLETPANAQYVVKHIANLDAHPTATSALYDADMRLLKQRSVATNLDPRLQYWFDSARQTKQVIRSEPYYINSLAAAGFTYAKSLTTDDGVIGIDVPMSSINSFLSNTDFAENSNVFLFNRYGEKVASSMHQVTSSVLQRKPESKVSPINLTEEETQYLANKGSLKVSNQMDWAPIDFADRGMPAGYSVDLMKLIGAQLGIPIEFINGYSWQQILSLLRAGDLDLVHSAYRSEDRLRYSLFSEPYHQIQSILILPQSSSVDSMQALNGKRVAIPTGWATIEFLKSQYPKIVLELYDNATDAYLAVEAGLADATIDDVTAMQFFVEKYQLQNLKVGPRVAEFDQGASKPIFVMTGKDQPLLHKLVNKALAAITEQEKANLFAAWQDPFCTKGKDCKAIIQRDDIVDKSLMLAAKRGEQGLIRFDKLGEEHLGFSMPMANFETSGNRMGLAEPTRTFTEPYLQQVRLAFLMALAATLLAIPLIMFITHRILRPLRELMVENDKVAGRHFKQVGLVKTNIIELHRLSRSLIHMADSIEKYEKSQAHLLESIIQLIADAIDAKSAYTAGHCSRVPEIAMMLTKVASDQTEGPFKHFCFATEDQWREFRTGAWLHDCGKVTTPEYVVDKATKLETIYNRIHEIRTRFEVLWRDAEITSLNKQLAGENADALAAWLHAEREKLKDDFAFIARCNIGGESMQEEDLVRLNSLAATRWYRHFDERLGMSQDELGRYADTGSNVYPVAESLLADKANHIVPRLYFDEESYAKQGFKLEVPTHLYNYGELYNLSISRGTLTQEERFKINEHIIQTIKMLEQLPLPENMQRVPEYAGTHHETLKGTGYPRKLTEKDLSTPARIMILADIFEALTASDRPYKKGKSLSASLSIMRNMVVDDHIDADVFNLFLTSGVYLSYAQKYLSNAQIDRVDIQDYLIT